MNDLILIDTDILIDVSRKIPTAINRLEMEDKKAKFEISVITKMETRNSGLKPRSVLRKYKSTR